MKKLMCLAVLALAGVLSCSPSSKKQEQNTCNEASCPIHLEAGASVGDTISEENWQFTLTGDGWEPAQSPDDTIKVVFLNRSLKSVVFLAKDPTSQSSSEYIIDALRSFKAAGAAIQVAKQVNIGGNKFIYVVANSEERQIQTWITVKDKVGYLLTCTGDITAEPSQFCQDIASTLQIN